MILKQYGWYLNETKAFIKYTGNAKTRPCQNLRNSTKIMIGYTCHHHQDILKLRQYKASIRTQIKTTLTIMVFVPLKY